MGARKGSVAPLLLVSTVIVFLVSLSGCSISGNYRDDPVITTEQMDKALTRVNVYEDDYTGTFEINPKSDTEVHVGEFWFIDSSALLSNKGDGAWEFAVSSGYRLTEWLFQESVGFKSTKGAMSVPLGQSISDVDELASVSEIAFAALDRDQIDQFCEIMNGRSVKFRIVGSKGQIERKMPGAQMYANRAMCTIFKGLEQGIEITRK